MHEIKKRETSGEENRNESVEETVVEASESVEARPENSDIGRKD